MEITALDKILARGNSEVAMTSLLPSPMIRLSSHAPESTGDPQQETPFARSLRTFPARTFPRSGIVDGWIFLAKRRWRKLWEWLWRDMLDRCPDCQTPLQPAFSEPYYFPGRACPHNHRFFIDREHAVPEVWCVSCERGTPYDPKRGFLCEACEAMALARIMPMTEERPPHAGDLVL